MGSNIALSNSVDSLIELMEKTDNTDALIQLNNQIANTLRNPYPDSAMYYYKTSLNLAVETKNHQMYAEIIGNIGVVWALKQNIDSATYFINRSIKLAKENNYNNVLIKGLNSQGLLEIKKLQYNSSIPIFNKALEIEVKYPDLNLYSKIYNNLGLAYNRLHKYDSALFYYLESLKTKEQISDFKGIGTTTNNIALVYEKLGDINLSIEYLERSLKLRIKNENKYGEAIVYNNLGLMYERKLEYEKSLEYYLMSLEIMETMNQKARIATCYNNIGSIYATLKDYRRGIRYLNKALKINLELNDARGTAHSYLDLAEFYKRIRNYYKAIRYYKKCHKIAIEIDDYDLKINCFQGLHFSFEQINQLDSSLHYYKTLVAFKDSLSLNESKQRVELLEIEYQTLKKEKENHALLKENEIHKARLKQGFLTAFLLAGFLLFFIIISIITTHNRFKTKKAMEVISSQKNEIQTQSDKLKKAYSRMKELSQFKEEMSGMIVHDLKNPINTIINIADSSKNNENTLLIKHSGKKMLNLVMNILDVQKYEDTGFEIHPQATELRYIIIKAIDEIRYYAKLNNVNIEIPQNTDFVINVDPSIFERILVNLLTNAIKFSPTGSKIEIKYETLNDNKFKIHIVDKGPGIKAELIPIIFEKYGQSEKKNIGFSGSTGIGLTFCKLAIESHNGEIGVQSKFGKGSDFWLSLDFLKKIRVEDKSILNKITSDISDLYLSYQAKELLNPFIYKIANFPVYQISDIRKVINKLNDLKEDSIKVYTKELNEAVLACNDMRYSQLIDLVLK